MQQPLSDGSRDARGQTDGEPTLKPAQLEPLSLHEVWSQAGEKWMCEDQLSSAGESIHNQLLTMLKVHRMNNEHNSNFLHASFLYLNSRVICYLFAVWSPARLQ